MSDRSISDLLSSIQAAEDDDSLFIVAAAINLYSEAMRRKTGRILYTVEDVKALGAMCGVLLTHPEPAPIKPTRPVKPTAEEAQAILEPGIDMAKGQTIQ